MRDYVLHQAHVRQSYGALTTAVRIIKNWRMQRSCRILYTLDDYMLKDIGLTRGDLNTLMTMPLSADVPWEFERMRLLASKERQQR